MPYDCPECHKSLKSKRSLDRHTEKFHAAETDRPNYKQPDSGCHVASKALQKPSSCLNCPFAHCFYTITHRHQHKITGAIRRQVPLPKILELCYQ